MSFTYFSMEDPTVGGYTREQIALRRAIAMGFNTDELIRVLFNGMRDRTQCFARRAVRRLVPVRSLSIRSAIRYRPPA